MKKFFALFLMFCVLLNLVVLASADEHIWSNASEWAVDELKNAEIAGLIPESFNDKDLTESVTREEFAEISVKAYEKIADVEAEVPDEYETEKFSDHEEISEWAVPSVYFMVDNGIISGTGDGKFEPKRNENTEDALYGTATREQALLISVRLVDKFKLGGSDNDNPPAVDRTVENEFVDGKEDYRKCGKDL